MLKATLLAVAVLLALCNSSRSLLQTGTTGTPAQPSTTSGTQLSTTAAATTTAVTTTRATTTRAATTRATTPAPITPAPIASPQRPTVQRITPMPPGRPLTTQPPVPLQAVQPPSNPYPQPQQPVYNPYGQQQQQQYNPYGNINMNNPYCNPMYGMYDQQKCFEFSFMYQQAAPGYGQTNQLMNNPYCNPIYGSLDHQKCAQYALYLQQQAPGNQQPASGGNPYGQQTNPISPMNPYCNPYSGNYDVQDCLRSSYGYGYLI